MALLTTGLGYALGSGRLRRQLQAAVPALGWGSLIFGAWYAVAAL
jgi:hypothetical protein